MRKPTPFRRFLLIMVFLLEGLSLAVVIGFLFAVLERSMQQEQVSRINVRQAELRLHLTNRLNYTHARTEELRFNNNIKISLLLGLGSKITQNVRTLYPRTMGSSFYIRCAQGRYYPQLDGKHEFLRDSRFFASRSSGVKHVAVNAHTIVYLMPIFQQDRKVGHAVGIYDLTSDSHCSQVLATYSDLYLVHRDKMEMKELFSPRRWSVPSHQIIERLSRRHYQRITDEGIALSLGMKDFASLFLIVDNQQYRLNQRSLIVKLVILCILLLLLTFSVSFIILKRVTCELDALAKGAFHIADSDSSSDLDTTNVRHAEFLFFTQAFNKVLATVRQRTKDLKTANEHLQQQIEERRQIADALRQSEAQLRSLQNNIPIGLFRRSSAGRILFANPKMVSIFGFKSEAEMIQIPIHRLYYDAEQYDYVMDRFDSSEDIQNLEIRFKRKDGSLIWGAVHLKKSRDPKTDKGYIDGALIDITERKKIEADKLQLEAQLRQAHKMEALGTLAGGIAHDFNNILFAIIGFCELAVDTASDKVQRDNLQQALAGARRAADLVRQILTFARQTDIERHPLDLTAIVKEGLRLMRATLPRNITIETELEGRQTILADPTQMHQIIVNLCTNACHAMRDRGGALTIGLSDVDVNAGHVLGRAGLATGTYVRLKVADTGHGMAPDIAERIFDPYFTTKKQGEGTGMGLSVVQGIVRGLNGTIRVDSRTGQGTTFNVYLPELKVDHMKLPDHRPVVEGGQEHILFVDDELSLTRLMSRLLTKLGYRVTTRNNPLEALDLFRRSPERFDLVISDVTMPQMSGYDMVQEMMTIRPNLPVILCTGYSENVSEKIVSQMGVRGLLHKPLATDLLCSAIRGALDARTAA